MIDARFTFVKLLGITTILPPGSRPSAVTVGSWGRDRRVDFWRRLRASNQQRGGHGKDQGEDANRKTISTAAYRENRDIDLRGQCVQVALHIRKPADGAD
jgi:hypothetical protein